VLESKSSELETPSHLDQSRPKLKLWTPRRLNLMVVTHNHPPALPSKEESMHQLSWLDRLPSLTMKRREWLS